MENDAHEVRPSTVEEAAEALARGGVVAFPTDTVYGLGVAVNAAESPSALFALKRRPEGKPVAWLVGGAEDLDRYGAAVPDAAREMAAAHWPGPLTLVVRAGDAVPRGFQSEEGTIGLRMPDNGTALALIRAVGAPLATTSANLSGDVAPSRFADLDPRILEGVDAAVRDDCPKSGLASTVLDCTGSAPRVLRQGAIALP